MVVVLVVLALGGLTACGDDGDPVSVGGTPDDSLPTEPEEPGDPDDPVASLPEDDATVEGVIVSGDAGPELTDVTSASANDAAYYAGAILSFSDSGTFVDADGESISTGDVYDQPAEIWLGPCAESFPVQCEVLALRLLG